MSKYTFIKHRDEENEKHDRSNVTFEFEAITLEEIFESLEDFLRGSAFTIDGHIELVKGDE